MPFLKHLITSLTAFALVAQPITGSAVAAGGDARITAGRDVTVAAAENRASSSHSERSKTLLGKAHATSKTEQLTHEGAVVAAGGNVTLEAKGRDVTVKGSNVSAATGDATLQAERDVNIEAVQDTYASESSKKKSGFFAEAGGGSATVGYRKEQRDARTNQTVNQVSGVTAGGNVNVDAGRDVTSQAGVIAAGEDITVAAGRDVKQTAVEDTYAHSERHKTKQIGITAQLSSNVASAARSVQTGIDGVKTATPGTGKAISGAAAALRAADAAQAVTNPSISASVLVGVSKSSSEQHIDERTARVGQVSGGRDVTITAGRDVKSEGTQVGAGRDATIDAGRDVTIESAQSTYKERSKSSSASASIGVGVSAGTQGAGTPGVTVSASGQKSQGRVDATTHTNARVDAGRDITVRSGRDTGIAGGNVEADGTVALDVGRDLTIASRQNTVDAQSSSTGGSVSVTLGPTSVPSGGSVSANAGKGGQDRAFTDDQTTIAGREGVQVRTEEHTQVDGAVIKSDEGAVEIDTGTFGHSDLQDRDRSENVDVTVGLNLGAGENNSKTDNAPTATIEGSYGKSVTEGVSRATVSGADGETITIRDKAKQAELEASGQTREVAAVNRDADRAQQITRQQDLGFSFYASDTSVKKAVESVEVVGRAINDVATEVFKSFAELGNPDLAAVGDAMEDGRLTTEGLMQQLAGCGTQQGFNLWHWLVGTAHAAQGCSIKDKDGQVIRTLSIEDHEKCKDVLALLLTNPEYIADEAGKDGVSLIAAGREFYYALGRRGAMLEGNRAVFVDENGDTHLLENGNGDPIYYNALNGKFFVDNDEAQTVDSFILSGGALTGSAPRVALSAVTARKIGSSGLGSNFGNVGKTGAGVPGRALTKIELSSVALPKLPTGYHYRSVGGEVQVVRNPGQAGNIPQLHLRGGQLTPGPKPTVPRSNATKSAFLQSLANSENVPSSIRPWLAKGRVPPGYAVHHQKALFDGGTDTLDNMVLQGIDLHKLRHRFYRPGGQVPTIKPPSTGKLY